MSSSQIQIITIVTNNYINYLESFVDSLKHFFPGYSKKLTVISDKNVVIKNGRINEVEVVKILDLLYPSINVNKTYFIEQCADKTCDFCFYFDIDTVFLDNPEYDWNTLIDKINDNYILLAKHPFYAMGDNDTWGGSKRNDLIKNFFSENLTERNKWSSAYIGDESYIYVNSAFFGGKTEDVVRFCQKITEMEKMDLQRHFIPDTNMTYHIPQFIDENYFNRLSYDYTWGKTNEFKFIVDQFSKLYSKPTYGIKTIFMSQKDMPDFKTNRR